MCAAGGGFRSDQWHGKQLFKNLLGLPIAGAIASPQWIRKHPESALAAAAVAATILSSGAAAPAITSAAEAGAGAAAGVGAGAAGGGTAGASTGLLGGLTAAEWGPGAAAGAGAGTAGGGIAGTSSGAMGSTGLFGIGADKWKAGADAFGKASYGLKQAGVLDQPQQPQAQRPPMSQPMGATMPLYGQDDLQSKIAMLSPDERRKLEMMLQQRGYA